MVEQNEHRCEDSLKVKRATIAAPYHFIDSGLPNVYLVGVRYSICAECGKQAADIPSVKELMKAIARAIVEKEIPLSGREIRFLRKRLGKKAIEFAQIIGVSPEQVSRWENDSNPPEKSAEKLIRICYSLLSHDKHLGAKPMREFVEKWTTPHLVNVHNEKIQAALKDHEWEAEPVGV